MNEKQMPLAEQLLPVEITKNEESNNQVTLDASDPFGVREVGVGPWPGGEANWPAGEQYDQELLRFGDRRNVQDKYRYWSVEAIVADLDKTRVPIHLAIENLEHDINIGSLVRTANAFNLAGVHIVGKKRWNRRGAMVTDRYVHIYHHPTAQDLSEWAAQHNLSIVAVDILEHSTALESTHLPNPALLVLGQEGPGLSSELLAIAEQVVHVTQLGSTRSINVAAAGAIAMWAWMQQHGYKTTLE